MRAVKICLAMVLLLLALPAQLQTQTDIAAARRFVQGFYRWYEGVVQAEHRGPAWAVAVQQKPALFSPQLLGALRDDLAAQAKAEGELVGLDTDPFLNAQDPEGAYALGKVTRHGSHLHIAIHGIRDGKKDASPAVIAEVAPYRDSWRFVNFRLPQGDDLLGTLAALRRERHMNGQPSTTLSQ